MEIAEAEPRPHIPSVAEVLELRDGIWEGDGLEEFAQRCLAMAANVLANGTPEEAVLLLSRLRAASLLTHEYTGVDGAAKNYLMGVSALLKPNALQADQETWLKTLLEVADEATTERARDQGVPVGELPETLRITFLNLIE